MPASVSLHPRPISHSNARRRGIYCLLVVACLLNVLTPELVAGTAAFIASCQTYEGGFASASHPYFPAAPSSAPSPSPAACLPSPRPNLGEAHGGYTSCALAAWVLLEPLLPAAQAAIARTAAPSGTAKMA